MATWKWIGDIKVDGLTVAGTLIQFDGVIKFLSGAGSPEGSKIAPVGSVYLRTDGGGGSTLYVKQTGTGNTGWDSIGATGDTSLTIGDIILSPVVDNYVYAADTGGLNFTKTSLLHDESIDGMKFLGHVQTLGTDKHVTFSHNAKHNQESSPISVSTYNEPFIEGEFLSALYMAPNLTNPNTLGRYGLAAQIIDMSPAHTAKSGIAPTVTYGQYILNSTYGLSLNRGLGTEDISLLCRATITSITAASGTITVLANNNFRVDDVVTLYVDTGAGSMNGKTFLIESASATQFTGFYSIANFSATPSTGFAVSAVSTIRTGRGTPEGVVTASLGSIYTRADGAVGTAVYIKETASGNTGWRALAVTPPGGSNTQVQFNDSSVFGGSANFTFNKTLTALAIGNAPTGHDFNIQQTSDRITDAGSGDFCLLDQSLSVDVAGASTTTWRAIASVLSLGGSGGTYVPSKGISQDFTVDSAILSSAPNWHFPDVASIFAHVNVQNVAATAGYIVGSEAVLSMDAGTSNVLVGMGSFADLTAGYTVNEVYGFRAFCIVDNNITVSLTGLRIDAPGMVGSVPTVYGIYIGDQKSVNVTTAWGIYETLATERNALGTINIGGESGPLLSSGTGSPETVVTAIKGSAFLRTDGDYDTTLYIKESGSGNTGWKSVGSDNVATKTTTYAATMIDDVILCNGTFTVTLPTTFPTKKRLTVKNIGTGTVTVASAVSIDNVSSIDITGQYSSMDLVWDLTQWWIV